MYNYILQIVSRYKVGIIVQYKHINLLLKIYLLMANDGNDNNLQCHDNSREIDNSLEIDSSAALFYSR